MDAMDRLLQKTVRVTHVRSGKKWRCWQWTGATIVSRGGKRYGQIFYEGKVVYVHRLSYLLHHGSTPAKHHVNHKCENTLCVNPRHIELMTPRENLMYSDTPARRNSEKQVCKYGHKLSGSNLIVKKNGWRNCRTCQQRMNRESKARRRARIAAQKTVDSTSGTSAKTA